MNRRRFLGGVGATLGAAAAASGTSGGTAQPGTSGPGRRMRELLARDGPLMCPGAYDVLSARLIQDVGFEALVVGGSACSASMHGVPDFGIVTVTELVELAGRIASNVDVPVLADADDAGGNPLNVHRAVQGFEGAGLAAVMIEDHVQLKHVGEGGELVPTELMVEKIRAAVDARRDPDFIVLARADSVSNGESVAQALERGSAYAEAGADLLFFAGMELVDCRRAASELNRPLMTTVTDTPLDELKRNGISLAVYAAHALQLALGEAYRGLRELKSRAAISGYRDRVVPRDVYQRLIEADVHRDRAKNYGLT